MEPYPTFALPPDILLLDFTDTPGTNFLVMDSDSAYLNSNEEEISLKLDILQLIIVTLTLVRFQPPINV